jgi:hypothetical protein
MILNEPKAHTCVRHWLFPFISFFTKTLGKFPAVFSFFPTKKEKLRFLPEDGALLHPPSIV